MRKLVLLFLLAASPAAAQNTSYPYRPVAGAQHGLSTTATVGLTAPMAAVYATVCARSSVVNYTTDGATTPTSSVGTPIAAGACVGLPGSLFATFSAIGAGATLDIEYFR